MDENVLNIGDTVAESGVGPGTVDGFDRNGYPMVNGQAVGRLTRTDGRRFGGSAGTLRSPDNAGAKREPVQPVGTTGVGVNTAHAPATAINAGLTTVHPVPAPTAAPEPPPAPAEPAPAPVGPPAEAPSEPQAPVETPAATPVATQAAETPAEPASAPAKPAPLAAAEPAKPPTTHPRRFR
jgi:hypothetical protein